jgi:hypothetical protein
LTTLLDGSVLIPLVFPDHDHHAAARVWFSTLNDTFASCPITQGSLLRYVLRQGGDIQSAQAILSSVTALSLHVFWADSVGYEAVKADGVFGHSQVTDAYLAQLARVNDGRLATFDEGLAALHGDVAQLIPVAP